MYQTDHATMLRHADEREVENDDFKSWLKGHDDALVDGLVHSINDRVSAAIDCTECARCCKQLMINVTPDEMTACATHLAVSADTFKEKYLEESQMGKLYINTIPCHFLEGTRCGIYTHRFADCRDFPNLHKPGFKPRLLGTLLHYGRCPIVYNVVEELKTELGFNA